MNAREPSTQSRPALPDHWVRRLFAELQGSYGSRFLDMWRTGQALQDGSDAGVANAQRMWAEKLGGFADCPECIKKALDSLPPHPPTLPEFLALCRQQQPDARPSLPAPALTEDERRKRSAQIKAGAASLVNGIRVPHPKAWAHGLREDYLKGAKLKPIQIELASGALGEVWERGVCRRANEEAEA